MMRFYLNMVLSIAVATIGILLAVLMYLKNVLSPKTISEKLGFLYDWSLNRFYFDENYNRFLYQPFLRLANTISWIDWEFYDKYFINGFGRVTNLFSKLSGKLDYDGIDQVCILGTVTSSGIPRATPQKHKDFPLFLKGVPVGSSGGATTHFAAEKDSCGAATRNCSFSHGF